MKIEQESAIRNKVEVFKPDFNTNTTSNTLMVAMEDMNTVFENSYGAMVTSLDQTKRPSKCRRPTCTSTKLIKQALQFRRGDEESKIMWSCMDCGMQWKAIE